MGCGILNVIVVSSPVLFITCEKLGKDEIEATVICTSISSLVGLISRQETGRLITPWDRAVSG